MPQPGTTWGGAATSKAPEKAPSTSAPTAIERAQTQTAASTSAALDNKSAPVVTAQAAVQNNESTSSAEQQVQESAPAKQMSNLRLSDQKADSSTAPAASTPSKAEQASQGTPGSNMATQATKASATSAVTSNAKAAAPSASVKKPAHATHWSRAFLAGKTHLKPEYEDVHNINSTTSASVQLLKANTKYFFYPLAGPGGRLAYHEIKQKGRFPVQIPCIGSGHDIVDFAFDPFNESRVFIAGSDGRVRVFELTDDGQEEVTGPATVLDGKPRFCCIRNPADTGPRYFPRLNGQARRARSSPQSRRCPLVSFRRSRPAQRPAVGCLERHCIS